jgi:hypothetical protein
MLLYVISLECYSINLSLFVYLANDSIGIFYMDTYGTIKQNLFWFWLEILRALKYLPFIPKLVELIMKSF